MPWNGSGGFQRLYSWVADKAAAINITASRVDGDENDIITQGLGNCVTRDGQGFATANQPMGGFRHTGVQDGVARTDYASLAQLEDGIVNWQAAGGAADALTVAYAPAVTVLKDGQLAFVRATAPNATTTPTLAVNATTARTITKQGGAAVAIAEWVALEELVLRYNLANTRWERVNGRFTAGTLSGALNETSVTLASAATVNIGAAAGNYLQITGTTGISSFGPSVQAGVRRRLTFQGILLLSSSSSLICPGGNITTAAGDSCEVEDEGSNNWRITSYQPASGKAVVVPQFAGVRQTVLSGAVDGNGAANFITTTAGLTANLLATASSVTVAFALGYGAAGPVDAVGQFSADQASFWSSIPANNLSFLSVDRNAGTGALTATQTLVPPQYGQVFDRTKNALLHFEGANLSTTFTDDFGNSWAAGTGAPTITTSQFKFGTASLDLTGGSKVIEAAGVTNFIGGDSILLWEGFVRFNALPAASTMIFASAINAAGWGFSIGLNDTAGTKKLVLAASSNGTSLDVASSVLGTNTTWATATQYHVAVVFDKVAGKYFVYKDGVADVTVTSTARPCSFAKYSLGAQWNGAAYQNSFNGWMDEVRMGQYCPYPNGTTFAPPASAFAVTDRNIDFFSIPKMQMLTVSAASGGAGNDPTFTANQRVYIGEATAGAAAVSAVQATALQGIYVGAWTASLPGSAIVTSKTHNLGTDLFAPKLEFQNLTAELGFVPGDILIDDSTQAGAGVYGPHGVRRARNAVSFVTGTTQAFLFINSSGLFAVPTQAFWQYRFVARRSF